MDDFNFLKEKKKISPYVGFEFSEEPLGDHGIHTCKNDNPKFSFNVNKMRQNIHCQKNPNAFREAKKGKFTFAPKNVHVVRNYHNMQTIKNPEFITEENDFYTAHYKDTKLSMNKTFSVLKNPVKPAENIFDKYRQVTETENSEFQNNAPKNFKKTISTGPANFFHKRSTTTYILPQTKKVANSLQGALVPIGARSFDRFVPLDTENTDLDIKVENLRKKKVSHSFLKTKENVQFDKIVEEGNPKYVRENCEYKDGKISKFNNNWTAFNKRVNKSYDPSRQPFINLKWDVKKKDVVQFITKNKTEIAKSQNQIKNINRCNQLVDQEHHYPVHLKTRALPNKQVYNDYHMKNTAAGFNRNYDGKPFFS